MMILIQTQMLRLKIWWKKWSIIVLTKITNNCSESFLNYIFRSLVLYNVQNNEAPHSWQIPKFPYKTLFHLLPDKQSYWSRALHHSSNTSDNPLPAASTVILSMLSKANEYVTGCMCHSYLLKIEPSNVNRVWQLLLFHSTYHISKYIRSLFIN